MGRYYQGNIEGKFWFAIQSSDDGEFFGAQEENSNWINYYLEREVFEKTNGIKECKKALTFKHNGKTKRWWVLHDKYQKVVDKYYKDNKDNPEIRYNYISFSQWLKNEHDIGNGEESFSESMNGEFRYIWKWLARLNMGKKMEKYFKDNPNEDYLTFEAEC